MLFRSPRNVPTRTAFGAMTISYYMLLWFSGDNDIIATAFHLAINDITWALRVLIFVIPVVVFIVTKRVCLGLQRKDRERLLHGNESGRILRLPHGEFIEVHTPVSDEDRAVLLAKTDIEPLSIGSGTDRNGVRDPRALLNGRRAALSRWFYSDNVALPSDAELAQAAAHAHHGEIAQH